MIGEAHHDVGAVQETNIEFVAQLLAGWRTVRSADVPDVGPDWGQWREISQTVPRMFHGHGDHVIVRAERRRPDGAIMPRWLVFRFHGASLISVAAFADEAAAKRQLQPELGS